MWLDHGQPRSETIWPRLTVVNHGRPWTTTVDHGDDSHIRHLTTVDRGQPWSTTVTHKSDHGRSWSTAFDRGRPWIHATWPWSSSRYLTVDHELSWSTIKYRGDHGRPWSITVIISPGNGWDLLLPLAYTPDRRDQWLLMSSETCAKKIAHTCFNTQDEPVPNHHIVAPEFKQWYL